MKLFDRVLLFGLSLAGLFTGAVAVLIALGWRKPVDLLEVGLLKNDMRLTLGLAGAVVALLALHFLFGRHHAKYPANALVRKGNMGETWISVEALENLVSRTAKQINGIREVKPRIRVVTEGIAVMLRISTFSDARIPGLAEEIQDLVKGQVRTTAGIEVLEVRVLVENLAQEARARVE